MTLPILPVDFNSADQDHAVRLGTRATLAYLNKESLQLHEGMEVLISDDELSARAKVTMRDGMWVAVVWEWLET